MTHLLTGATGFLGGALALSLLDRPGERVVALVRATGADADARLRACISEAAVAYGRDPESVPWERLRAVAGDIREPACGVEAGAVRADVLWHSAASLRYEDRYATEIRATNVDGTRNVLALARAARVEAVNTFSTAYVSGARQGWMDEVPRDASAAQNHYERSKVDAEAIALAEEGVSMRIFRPSTIVGHSRTLAATTFSGLYGFVRQLGQYRGILERMQPGLYRERRLRIVATPDGPKNMICVDAVAEQAVQIGTRADAGGIYHLTEADEHRIGDAIDCVAELLGFPPPEYVEAAADLEWLDQQFNDRLDFYGSYIRGFRRFSRERADAALGPEAHRPAVPPLHDLVRWYLARLDAERRPMPAAR